MKVTIKHAEESTLEEFADKYGFEMEVSETRGKGESPWRYSAQLKGKCLCWNPYLGVGSTPEEAIADYTNRISGRRMEIVKFRLFGADSHFIQVPRLVEK